MSTRANLSVVYEQRLTQFNAELAEATRKINLISNLRLAVAIIFLLSFYFFIARDFTGWVALGSLLIFLWLVKKHALMFSQKTHLENLVKINRMEKSALNGDLKEFATGNEFINTQHHYSHDLDIFGEGSLFQYLNRCTTLSGKSRLAWHLENPFKEKLKVTETQKAAQELSGRIDFRQHLQAAGMEVQEVAADREQLIEWTRQPLLLKNLNLWRVLLIVIPAITLIALIGTFYEDAAKPLLGIAVAAQWVITGFSLKKLNVYHDYINRKKNILEKYSLLLAYVEKEKFESPLLQRLHGQSHTAARNVKKLASLVSAFDARTNMLASVFVNSFLLYDLQCVYRLERWRRDNAAQLSIWLDTITEMEVLNSVATFSYNHPSFTFAEISDDLKIEAKEMGHPLIGEDIRVSNDLTFGTAPHVLIVTGANMAGKSTFLRTLGVNMVLALNGAPVCASSFSCPFVEIRSGMRTADSLKDHQSYFFAELNRLKTIMDELRSDKPLLILLDEILKGTNSNDKQAGSIALVQQLLPHPCLAIIATHDLALSELEKKYSGKVTNYSFEATIIDDQLSFDYELNRGVATKMNASFLMRKMGIITGKEETL